MALYSGAFGLAEGFAAPLTSDRPDGLWPTVVTDRRGVALGLAWSDAESLTSAIETGRGVYHSRSSGLWEKGLTSGATQSLVRVDVDCDRDALRFTVDQAPPGFCHTASPSCWGDTKGLDSLQRSLEMIAQQRPNGSNTVRLLDDPDLLRSKLVEEAEELARARPMAKVAEELADVLYFAMVKATAAGVRLADAEAILDRRSQRVRRRPMTRKDTQ
jgi:phosphoribosyl-ATP pyrophosphohydrolase